MAPTVSALLSAPMKPGVAGSSIASRWRELHGAQSWAGLLDPLDDDLRAFLIAYGELVSAAHDGFNNEVRSPHHGTCMYSHADVLAASTVSHPEYYTVTKFLYAISGGPATMFGLPVPVESNWMGYVAVATDEGVAALGRRDIVVAWRGTERDSEMANDLDVLHQVSAAPVLGPFAAFHPRAVVHRGFLFMYTSTDKDSKYNKTSARDQVLQEVRRLMEVHKDEVTSITVAGHSLGASLATLNAVDIVANGFNNPHSIHQQPCPVAAILFACPHVGNDKFKSALASFQHLRALHVKNAPDIMPHLPGPLLGFVDAATMALHIDTGRSPYLYPRNDDVSHNLECYLHAIDGDHGDGMDFKLVMGRDIALVNKNANVLKDEYPVPANWWVAKNKWMIKGADGQWKLDDFKEG